MSQKVINLCRLKPRDNHGSYDNIKDVKLDISSVWNRFDRIFCIHYLPYQDRFTNIQNQFRKVGILDLPQFEWYFTINNELYQYVLKGIPKEKIDLDRVNMRNIKLTIDSYSLLKKIQQFNYKKVLIVEDDIAFHKDLNFIRDVVNSTPEDFDVMNYDPDILLDKSGKPIGNFTDVNSNIQQYENAKIINMSCCALSGRMVDLMVYRQKNFLEPFDIYSWKDTKDMKTYCVKPNHNICIQDLKSYIDRQSDRQYGEKYAIVDIGNYSIGQSARENVQLVVSLTSYPHRFQQMDFLKVLNSLVQQKTKVNYKIALALYKDDIPLLPQNVLDYIGDNGIEIIKCNEDLKQHKKYFYTMQKYHGVPVMTVDDDTVYADNLVEDMYRTYLQNPGMIVCGRCCRIRRDSSGKMLTYNKWDQWYSVPDSKVDGLFGIGVGGILYPPDFCRTIDDRLLDVIPVVRSDDVLLHFLTTSSGFKYMTVDTKNRYAKNSGVGFFYGGIDLEMHDDSKAMWIVNCNSRYKEKSLDCVEKCHSLDELVAYIKSLGKSNV